MIGDLEQMTSGTVIALIGAGGAVIGSLSTMAGHWILHYLREKSEAKKDEPRRKLLQTMLKNEQWSWRKLETLRHVIGADEETARRLLLEIDARGSEDGQDLWGLIERNPFKNTQ